MEEPLLKPPASKRVVAYDLFGNKHLRNLKNFKFRVSAYGILLNRKRILMNKHPLINKYGLPGGGINIGEKIKKGLLREFKEETGLKVKINKLLAVDEDIFTYKGEDAHSILIFYYVERVGGKITTNDEDSSEVRWFSLKNITKDKVQRSFWQTISSLKRI